MNKMISLVLVSVALVGCMHQPVVYSHKDNTDWLTIESRGDNIADYADLKSRGEDMCASRGFKHGINVVSANPGGSLRSNNFGSFTLAYTCKDESPGVVDTAKAWLNKAQEKIQEVQKDLQSEKDK